MEMIRKSEKKRVQVDIDQTLASEAEGILSALEIQPASLIRSLYSRVVAVGGVPFDMSLTEKELADIQLSSAAGRFVANNPDIPKGDLGDLAKWAGSLDD
ncbi:RelB/DinJ family addiction module antitoxin [Vagococcus fluvialis]|uniref:RelB/DinJ family addiction module antitoxin n=1 Tax=Vagococcus fluvialis TaxID=2738 RepID=UPI001D0BD22E|nr:RelB/DinJ family addiction module antitoxin [Vagococcus fluvialis]UDM72714.1 RelB/DinJ family addiction module antitoxin [Vagococcus fluvialis]UDM78437.1 RelB/DinJ family addiction module antitoxin [Vagococcus fluvialis]UDM83989.1 RelB/DinJ family addiction module antitoxin [Vagococcus fluvialis]